ncbi:MAG: NYN domain-containing protein [Bacteroidia bacterium]
MANTNSRLTKIGVFYDGNYFMHVSNYYYYNHPRKARIDLGGLHYFIRNRVSEELKTDSRLCQIVDAHYFRGRLNAQDAYQNNKLFYDRIFDDVLMNEGVITHYFPLRNKGGRKEEKGLDVWLALEAYELAMYKKFDVVVLVGSDGDYVPLARKLNTLGVTVMVLCWDFEFTDDSGREIVTRTSQHLLEEVSFAVPMHELINNKLKRSDPMINNLFVQQEQQRPIVVARPYQELGDGERKLSQIFSLHNGFGFIAFPPNNLFFHYSDMEEGEFNELEPGDEVTFRIDQNDRGEDVAKQVRREDVSHLSPEEDEDEKELDEVMEPEDEENEVE